MSTASPKQITFIDSLLSDRVVAENWVARVETLDRATASKIIEALLALPAKQAPVIATDVPSGRYAIVVDGITKFYKVDAVTEGRWAGRTFVKVMASDEEHAVKNPQARQSILSVIQADVKAASTLYGQEIGSCGVCGRTLTDEASREAGVGPVCRDKMGW